MGLVSVLAVCSPFFFSCIKLRDFKRALTNKEHPEQYALTEASYVLVRLLRKISRVENAQPEIIEPLLKLQLTIGHAEGVKVRLYTN